MPSTYSPNLRFELMANGENDATWGTLANQVFNMIEDAISEVAVITHNNAADYTLTSASGTADEARCAVLRVQGTLTANRNVVCPAADKIYVVHNNTSGGFSIVVKTASGSGVTIPNGATMAVYCDGTNVTSTVSYLPSLTLGSALPITSGGTGSTSASAARTALGLAIGTDVQAYDATLAAIAGASTGADILHYFSGTDAVATTTLTSFGRSLIDDADASAARTTLGLVIGTNVQAYDADLASIAALTTTSFGRDLLTLADAAALRTTAGASTVGSNLLTLSNPGAITFLRLNADNTVTARAASDFRTDLGLGALALLGSINNANWSGTALAIGNGGTGATTAAGAATALGLGTGDSPQFTAINLGHVSDTTITRTGAGAIAVEGSTIWTAANDGAGSGLDADLLDGLQATAFGRLGVANTWTAAQTFNVNPELPAGIYLRLGLTGSNDWYLGKPNATDLYLYRDAGVAWIMTGTGLEIVLGTLLARLRAGSETSGTLTVASANRTCNFTGGITINNSVFSAGDLIAGYNNSGSSFTITAGAGVTMRLGGTATTGNRTALARGRFEIYFVSASECIVSGSVT